MGVILVLVDCARSWEEWVVDEVVCLDLGKEKFDLEVFFLAGIVIGEGPGLDEGMGLSDMFSSSSDVITSSLRLPKELEVNIEVESLADSC